MKSHLLAAPIALSFLACTTGPKPAPVHYPTLPPATGALAGEPSFEPAPTLRALTLACRSEELATANALDDDCNGHIDDGVAKAAANEDTFLAFAYPRAAAVRIGQRIGIKPALELNPEACDDESAYCTRVFSASALGRGAPSMLFADGTKLDAGAPPPSVVVSIQLRGKVHTYLAPVTPGVVEQPLGSLFLP